MESNADLRATACLLRSGSTAALAGHAGAILAGSGLLWRGFCAGNAVALLAWGVLVYLHVRVSLDAELFAWMESGGAPADVDNFLVRAGLIRAARDRSIDTRCRGAIRLWWMLLLALVIELAAVGASLVLGTR